MSDLVWIAVSVVAVSLLFVLLVVACVPLPLLVAGGLFFLSAVVAVGQIGGE